MPDPLTELVLSVADDKLVLGHRNSDWTGLAPILEEDIAFSALAQDDIAHAQALYELLAARTNGNADQLAFGRAPAEYRCASIVELPDDFDWAVAIVRQFYCDAFDAIRLERLGRSSDTELAALCRRLSAEQAAHETHSSGWITRLAHGAEARPRIQGALDALAPHAAMLLEPVAGEDELVSAGLFPASTTHDGFAGYASRLRATTEAAGLDLTIAAPTGTAGGRRGVHTPHLAEMLDEMSAVFRIAPDAAW